MIYLGAVCLLLIGLILFLLQKASAERADWVRERSELITRALHPEIVPRPQNASTQVHVIPEDEGELALVGQIIE